MLNSIVREAGKSVPKTDMTAFVGDVVECGFRNPHSDPENRVGDLVSTFCRKWSLQREEIAKIVDATVKLIHIEIQPDNVVQHPAVQSLLRAQGLAPHSWMQTRVFIGGDRNILNTHRLVQGLSNLLKQSPPTKLMLKPGFFGALWDEQRRPARKIQGDMDQLLTGDILPELLTNCQLGAFSNKIPGMDELFPFFKLLRLYVDKPTKPVPLSLTFGVHAILTSIFELQGHNDVSIVAIASKACV